MGWRNWAYWLKGAIIGALIGLLIFLLPFIDSSNLTAIFSYYTFFISLTVFCGGTPPGCGNYFGYAYAILHIFSYLLLGALIGLIYGKIRNKLK